MQDAVSTVERTDDTPARCPAMRGQMAPLGPSAVAVHDNGDVSWEPLRIQPQINFGLFAVQPGGNYSLQANLYCLLKLTQQGIRTQ